MVVALQGHEIQMSRALGHCLLEEYGLISEPDVIRLQLEPRHCCLIAASDGVWDHLTPREAVQIVMEQMDNGLDAKSASRELTRYAVEAALANGEADNATAVVYFLDF